MVGGTSSEGEGLSRLSVEWPERQQALLSALRERDDSIAVIYEGALHVLHQRANPERLRLAAHNLREWMKLFPRLAAVHSTVHGSPINNEAQKFVREWERAQASASYQPVSGTWSDLIDDVLRVFLAKVADYANAIRTSQPLHREKFVEARKRLERSGSTLPEAVLKRDGDFWFEHMRYFDGVAHHTDNDVAEPAFMVRLQAVEEYALSLLQQRVAEDLTEIDRLVREAESDDH